MASRLLAATDSRIFVGGDAHGHTYAWPWAVFRHWKVQAGLQADPQQGLVFKHISLLLTSVSQREYVMANLNMPLLRQRGHVMVPEDYCPQPLAEGQHAIDAVVEAAMVSLLLRCPAAIPNDPAVQAFACLVTERMLVDADGSVDDALGNRRQRVYSRYGDGLRVPAGAKWLRFCDDGKLHGSYRDG